MLMRFDPFRELDRFEQSLANARRAPVMPMDAYRRGEQFVVHFDLPGIDTDSIELTVEKNVLTVKAERGWTPQDGDDWVVGERFQGTYTRQLFLGDTLDSDDISAHYDKGVLTLTIPVAEKAKPRKVEITTGAGDGQTAINATSTAA